MVVVEVITPAVGDGPPVAAVKTMGFGALNLRWWLQAATTLLNPLLATDGTTRTNAQMALSNSTLCGFYFI